MHALAALFDPHTMLYDLEATISWTFLHVSKMLLHRSSPE